MQVRVTVMPFAISGGIVLLSRDSMLLQSAIIFVVSSERSLVLKKFIGSFRRCSAIRSRVVFDSLYFAHFYRKGCCPKSACPAFEAPDALPGT